MSDPFKNQKQKKTKETKITTTKKTSKKTHTTKKNINFLHLTVDYTVKISTTVEAAYCDHALCYHLVNVISFTKTRPLEPNK